MNVTLSFDRPIRASRPFGALALALVACVPHRDLHTRPDSSAGTAGSTSSGTGSSSGGSTTRGSGGGSGGPVVRGHVLLVSDDGVALASTPALSRLSQTVRVLDNMGLAPPCEATSDQAWLAVTPCDHAGQELALTANAGNLQTDTVHYATVRLSSTDSTVAGTDTIRVGFWVGSSTPDAATTMASAFSEVVTDPIRPYVYAHNRGTDITIVNIYTSAVVETISSDAARLGSMAVSSDGSYLFALDDTNFDIVTIDLVNRGRGPKWDLDAWCTSGLYLQYTRWNGVKLLFSSEGSVFDATVVTGARRVSTFNGGCGPIAASQNGSRLCTLTSGISPYTVTCYALTATGDGRLVIGAPKEARDGMFGKDVALNADGTRVYVASEDPFAFSVYGAATTETWMPREQLLEGAAFPNNVEVARDGRILGGAALDSISPSLLSRFGDAGPKDADTWLYGPNGVFLRGYYLAAKESLLMPRQLKFSGDGLRLVALTRDSLHVLTAGP